MPTGSPSPAATRARKAFQAECVDFFAETVQLFGVPKSVGQIYGLLYASPVPLSFSDIVERLEISKGSASQGLQLLRTLGAISPADQVGEPESQNGPVRFAPGLVASLGTNSESQIAVRASRVTAYLPELSLRKLISGVLHERVKPLASVGSDRLARLRELAESVRQAQGGEGSDFYLDRVGQLEVWRRKLKTVLPVLIALLGPKSRK